MQCRHRVTRVSTASVEPYDQLLRTGESIDVIAVAQRDPKLDCHAAGDPSTEVDAMVQPVGQDAISRRKNQRSARTALIAAIAEAMVARDLSQVQTARLCRTDQPTLSKVLRGRTESVTLDKLVGWLLSLGRS